MKNKHEVRGDITVIFIKRKEDVFEIMIDTSDLEKMIYYKNSWRLSGSERNTYARGFINNKTVLLHRYLLDNPEGYVVDHINHNTLDNRRSNLRIIKQSQNMQNRISNTKSKSGLRNIRWEERNQKWRVKICVNKKYIQIGRYKSLDEAIEAEVKARKKYMPYSQEALAN